MTVIISSIWSPSSDLYSSWLATIAVLCVLACAIVSIRSRRPSPIEQILAVVGVPILFITVLFTEAGMFVLKDGKDFGFPIWARAYPNASDFLATYIALGASYLIARNATQMPTRAVRIAGWVEIVGFASLAAFEFLLLYRRICVS